MKALLIIFLLIISIASIEAQGSNARILANEYYRNARILRSDKQYEASNSLIRKSIPLFKESKMWGKYLSAVETLAENFTDLENSDSTKYHWENLAAESVRLVGKNNRYELTAYLALSDFYLENEQLSKTAAMLQEAFELIKTKPLGREPFSVKAYTNLALIQTEKKLYSEAIQSFELAAKNADVKTVEPLSSANMYRHYANLLLKSGKAALALEKAEKSLKFYNAIYSAEAKNKVDLLLLKSEIHITLKDLNNAANNADDALKSAFNSPLLQGKSLKKKAEILILQAKYSEGEAQLQKAVELAQQTFGSKHRFIGEIYLDLAELSLKMNAAQKAMSFALKGQESLSYNSAINLSPIVYLQLINSELKAALLLKSQNLSGIEKKVRDFYELINRQQFSISYNEELIRAEKLLFENLLWANFENNKEKAFYWAEFYKLLHKRGLLQIDESISLNDPALKELKLLKLQKLQLFHELEKAIDRKEKLKASKLENLISETDIRIEKTLLLLKKNHSEFYTNFYAFKIPTVKEISANLKQESLLYFFATEEKYYKFFIGSNKLTATVFSKKQLDTEIEALLKQIASKSNKLNSENISKLILTDLGAVNGLVIAADGKIWDLPFELLKYSNILIVEKYNTRYIWSASDLMKNYSYEGKDLCFFSTNYKKQPNNRFPHYQAPYKEARNWSKNLNINYYRRYFFGDFEYNQQASESYFLSKNIKDFSLLHLAFFNQRDDSNPMNSSILMHFQPDSISDGVLHLNELSSIRLHLSLVSLSNFTDSSGFDDVAATYLLAFEATGAAALLYSSWQVDNAESAKFMREYYKNLAAGLTKSEALRKTKLSFKNKSPYYWASYRLYGQDGTVALRKKFRFPWLWVSIGTTILLILGLLLLRFIKRK